MDFSIFDRNYFQSALNKRIGSLGFPSTEAYFEYMQEEPNEQNILQNALYNHHSEFFRNRNNFNYIEYTILPQLIKEKSENGKKEIRIWSAACAAGQEAYSLAIICNELSQLSNSTVNVHIFASDISESEIEKAQRGVYELNHLNNITLKRLKENLKEVRVQYIINDDLKKRIEFSTFDLLDQESLSPTSSIFGGFDIVLCNNLLFYYNSEQRKMMINKISNNLVKNGFLIVDEAETGIINTNKQYICEVGTSIYRKRD